MYVVLFHVAAEFWEYQAQHVGPSRLMLVWQKLFGFGGHACVTLFICLSGFSLALPVAKRNYSGLSSKAELKNYAVRRFLRIAPPYYIAILFVLACATVIPGINTLESSIWRNALPIFDSRSILLHVLLLHGLDSQSLYQLSPQFWSIGTEAQIYLWLPLVIVPLARWKSMAWAVTASLAFCALIFLFPKIDGACLHYVFSFTMGAFVADALYNWKDRSLESKALITTLTILQAVAVAIFAIKQGSTFGFQDILLTIPFSILLYSLGSTDNRRTMISFAHKLLHSRPCMFLGKISYSLYLVHYVIIAGVHTLCIQNGLSVSSTVFTLMFGAPLLSILISTLMRRLVEEPCLSISSKFRNQKAPITR